MTFEQALAYLRANPGPSEEPDFWMACVTVAAEIDSLPYRILVQLPDCLPGDPTWNSVKRVSIGAGTDGNTRWFEPKTLRQTFVPAEGGPVTLRLGEMLGVKPIGSSAASTYARLGLTVLNDIVVLTIGFDPLAAGIARLLRGDACQPLSKVVDKLRTVNPIVLGRHLRTIRDVPLLGVTHADLRAATLTFIPDAACEIFSLESALAA